MKKHKIEFFRMSDLNLPDEAAEALSNTDITWGGADYTIVSGATLRAVLDENFYEFLEDVGDDDLVDLES